MNLPRKLVIVAALVNLFGMNDVWWAWVRRHQWRLLLLGMAGLLLISPISEIYDRQDNFITPPVTIVFLAVIFGTAERRKTVGWLTALTLVWFVISVATEGSGLFAGPSLLAPLLFMILLMAIFVLLARWLIRASNIDMEVICAATKMGADAVTLPERNNMGETMSYAIKYK